MKILTLIPSADLYGLIILVVLSLGSFPIARHIHIRWLSQRFSFIGSNAIVKSIIAIFGLLIVPTTNLFPLNATQEMIGMLAGVALGCLTVIIEMKMIRRVNRHNLINKVLRNPVGDNDHLRNAIITNKISLTSKKIEAKGLSQIRKGYGKYADLPEFINYSLISVTIVAIAEEFLFRGYMLSVSKLINNSFVTIFIICLSVFLFASSHMSSSWGESNRKLPLSVFAMAGYVMTGTLISSLLTHLILNVYAFMKMNASDPVPKNNSIPVGVLM
jgi:hypothetical protein